MGRRLRLQEPKAKRKAAPVIVVKKDAAATALAQCGGDSSRVRVLSESEVLVVNHKSQRRQG